MATSLFIEKDQYYGLAAIDLPKGKFLAFGSKDYFIIAPGGACRIYSFTT